MWLALQNVSRQGNAFDGFDYQHWIESALAEIARTPLETTVRIVDEDEMRELNSQFRGKRTPTNVLSFPFETIDGVDYQCLGDIVLCAPTAKSEAREQDKPLDSHCAHLIIHGTLHLCGYDHVTEQEAIAMESLEKTIMDGLGFADPYV